MPRMGDSDHFDKQPRVPKGYSGGGRWTDGDDQGEPIAPKEIATGRSDGVVTEQFIDRENGAVVRSEYSLSPGAPRNERHSATLRDGSVVTYEKSGPFHRIYENGRIVGTFRWTENGLVSEPTVQLAFEAPAPRPGKAAVITGALAIYRALMAQGWRQDGQIVGLAYDIDAMLKGERGEGPAAVPLSLTKQEVAKVCKKYGEAQSILNDAVEKTGRPKGMSAQHFGSTVHAYFDHEIKRRGDKNFVSEISVLKAIDENPGVPRSQIVLEARRGMGGTLRYDAVENVDGKSEAYCIYDPKTGTKGLTPARMAEMAYSARKHFNANGWIYVIEMRYSPQ